MSPDQEAERDRVLLAVGRALSNWSGVEHGVSRIFEVLTDQTGLVADIILTEIINANARVNIINEIFEYSLQSKKISDATFALWRPIKNKLTSLNKKRNEVAHFTLVIHVSDVPENGIGYVSAGKVRLKPYYSNKSIQENAPDVSLSAVQIEARAERFLALSMRLAALNLHVMRDMGKLTPEGLASFDEQIAQIPQYRKSMQVQVRLGPGAILSFDTFPKPAAAPGEEPPHAI